MLRRKFLKIVPVAGVSGYLSPFTPVNQKTELEINAATRAYWISVFTKIADPVLTNLSQQKLKEAMPPQGKLKSRIQVSYLEAFGRLLAGIAPWLELGADNTTEGKLRGKYIKLAHTSLEAATNPTSPDYMIFGKTGGNQPLVDAAFMAHGLLRGYTQLWELLSGTVKTHVLNALKLSREIKPSNNNWVLFSAMIEAFVLKAENDCDFEVINYAFTKMEEWYAGDGLYKDGPAFHFDYYNSFVIHPMLLDVAKVMADKGRLPEASYSKLLTRAKRYAAIQERMISPEGTFPAVGRSLVYRFGAFQLLSQITLIKQLPKEISPAQVREGLSAVINRMITAPNTFDSRGWLQIGFYGHQPDIAEEYISAGSVYLCSTGLLPLGLPANDPFWTDAPADWTSKKAWAGTDMPNDHAISE
ncbi:MAG TPA: DUF2264 domain-containing protein [Mucilaginibacter sp.]|jgi:hypothetical protein|nr:DUF2264 domain-containing protein [Mucilaginibacter sp.]